MSAQRPAATDLPTLTSLRFLAAGMIFAFHIHEFYPYHWAVAYSPSFYHGVSFFFVLSGFVLTYAYEGRDFAWRGFYCARLARIAPLHLFCMAMLAVLPLPFSPAADLGAAGAVASFIWKAGLLDAWTPVPVVLFNWNTVSWSISVEMAFYAAFPLLLIAMTRRPFFTLCASAVVALGVLDLGALWGLPGSSADNWKLTLINLGCCFPLARGFEFVLGMATCLIWRRWLQPARLSFAVWTAIEAVAMTGAVLWLVYCVPPLVDGAKGLSYVVLRAAGSCGIFALLIGALARGQGGVGRLLSLPPLVALGEASFAFYLIHFAVLRTWSEAFDPGLGPIPALAISLAMAMLLHRTLEAPLRARLMQWYRRAASRPRRSTKFADDPA